MSLWRIVWREIIHRKLNFALSLLAVILAVACAVSVVSLLEAQQQHTAQHVAVLEAKVEKDVVALDNEIRKITKKMGFNLTILPADQNLADFHAADFAIKTMPEHYVDQLAQSRDIITINHLRPALIRKLKWPERNRQVILMGVRGVVPFAHRDPKKPLAEPVPPGKMNIGSVLADELSIGKGASVKFLGADFEIDKIYPPRGNVDDITVWIDLPKAQELLDMKGQINIIQALECNCASIERLAEIETEVAGVLGNKVQVFERDSRKATARARARMEVERSGKTAVAAAKQNGEQTRAQWRRFAAILIPTVIVASALWVALLSLANVRQRRSEIGIWRTIGFRSRQILALFLSKAVLIGLVGAVVGCLLGALGASSVIAEWKVDAPVEFATAATLPVAFELIWFALVLTPILAVLASWLPAMSAATQDPAEVLREE